ncbi:MAG: dipeptidase [Symbiobacteriia bacterium]
MTEWPLVIDGHNDSLLNLYLPERGQGRQFLERSTVGHLDLPRAKQGGLGAGFFAIFAPGPKRPDDTITFTERGYEMPLALPLERGPALEMTVDMMALLFRLEEQSKGRMRVVRTVAELQECLDSDCLGAILHFEGAEVIDPDLGALEVFYRAGLRSLGLVWSRPNAFGHGVPFRYPESPDTGPGLTDAGRDLVRACNRLGILVDVSHLNERGFWDVAGLSTAPLVATHSAAHAICPSTRNLTDRQLDAIRDSDGLVGMNFEVCAVRPDGDDIPDTPLDVLVNEVDYLVDRLGIDRVAFGADFDGATMPREIGDVTGLPKLLAALNARGYDAAALAKLAHGNWLRVLAKTWR